MQPNTPTLGTSAHVLPPFDYPPALRPVYAIADGATADDLARLLSIRLTHLCAMVAGVKDACEVMAYLEGCAYAARECRELFRQIEARRAA